jgi:protein disulfide-isomerase
MKKIAAFLLGSSLALAAFPSLAFSQPSFSSQASPSIPGQLTWLKNYNDAVAQAQSSGKPIVLLFTGTHWCPACMKLEREVLMKPEFAQAISSRFIFLKAEFPEFGEEAVMASPYRSLLERYNVEAFPTIVVINANGQRLSTVNYQAGGPSYYINQLMQTLNQSASVPTSTSSYYQGQTSYPSTPASQQTSSYYQGTSYSNYPSSTYQGQNSYYQGQPAYSSYPAGQSVPSQYQGQPYNQPYQGQPAGQPSSYYR